MSTDVVLHLEHFLPYRLSVLSNQISTAISHAYDRRFKLSVTEWRVLAVLAQFPGISGSEVAERTAMDKVAISRAVANLLANGRIERDTHAGDRRRAVLHLSPTGESIYADVAPRARAYEQSLLDCLSADERAALDRILLKLRQQQKTAAEHL